jgi:hypothetical protein
MLYRLKVSAVTEVALETDWIIFHTLVPPTAVLFRRISSTLFKISWQLTLPVSAAEIGLIARLCTRRINLSEPFTCSRIIGSAAGYVSDYFKRVRRSSSCSF